MVINDAGVEDIYQRKLEKELIGAQYVAIFHVHLPQLVQAGYCLPSRQAARVLVQNLPLRPKDLKLLAQPVDLLVVDCEAIVLLQGDRELPVALGEAVAGDELADPLLDQPVGDLLDVLGKRIRRD